MAVCCWFKYGGGDVEAGLAIAEMIASMSKPTVRLFWEGDTALVFQWLYQQIIPSLHHPQHDHSSASVKWHDHRVPQTYEYFDRMQERVVEFVSKNSGIKEAFRKLMLKTSELANDVERFCLGRSRRLWIINEVGGLANALKKL